MFDLRKFKFNIMDFFVTKSEFIKRVYHTYFDMKLIRVRSFIHCQINQDLTFKFSLNIEKFKFLS